MDVNEELKVFGKIKKKKIGGGVGLGGQGGCERRIEVFVKIQRKKKFWWGVGGGVGGRSGGGVVLVGGQGGCEQGIEVFVKIKKRNWGEGGGGGGSGGDRVGGSGWM